MELIFNETAADKIKIGKLLIHYYKLFLEETDPLFQIHCHRSLEIKQVKSEIQIFDKNTRI